MRLSSNSVLALGMGAIFSITMVQGCTDDTEEDDATSSSSSGVPTTSSSSGMATTSSSMGGMTTSSTTSSSSSSSSAAGGMSGSGGMMATGGMGGMGGSMGGMGGSMGGMGGSMGGMGGMGGSMGGMGGAGGMMPAANVWINEFHYDNVSTDMNEGFEVAGTAGTDLTNWTIVLYNGSDGGVYGSTIALSGMIPNQQAGLGTLSLPANQAVQNGAPDGFALVDPNMVVVQFLSYEGTITATDGPATGMTSVDVGVSESSSTLATDSLYLTGTGSQYADFTWAGPAAATFGAVNTGQTFQ